MLVERTTVEDTVTAMKMPVVHGKEGETMPMTMKQQKTGDVPRREVSGNCELATSLSVDSLNAI